MFPPSRIPPKPQPLQPRPRPLSPPSARPRRLTISPACSSASIPPSFSAATPSLLHRSRHFPQSAVRLRLSRRQILTSPPDRLRVVTHTNCRQSLLREIIQRRNVLYSRVPR